MLFLQSKSIPLFHHRDINPVDGSRCSRAHSRDSNTHSSSAIFPVPRLLLMRSPTTWGREAPLYVSLTIETAPSLRRG